MKARNLLVLLSLSLICGCKQSGSISMQSPEEVYSKCIQKFQMKGDPLGVGNQICASMRDACSKDLNGSECQKAQRMITKG